LLVVFLRPKVPGRIILVAKDNFLWRRIIFCGEGQFLCTAKDCVGGKLKSEAGAACQIFQLLIRRFGFRNKEIDFSLVVLSICVLQLFQELLNRFEIVRAIGFQLTKDFFWCGSEKRENTFNALQEYYRNF
jgi:hypothetical protein